MKYYISDSHFGHENIIRLCNRPFNSVKEMDEVMIDRWNSVVNKNDEVYILGDLNFRSNTSGADYLRRLNGRKFIITGNHDNVTPEMRNLCEWVKTYAEVRDGNKRIVLFHYPIIEWNGFFRGTLHFYGHIHNSFENDAYKIMRDVHNAYNVGADILDFTPRTADEVIHFNQIYNNTH